MGGSVTDVEHLVDLGLIAVNADAAAEPDFIDSAALAEPDLANTEQLDVAGIHPQFDALPSGIAASISIESLWPQSAELDAHAQVQPQHAAPIAEADYETARNIALDLLRPLGLRSMQLRRTVEAANNAAQLRDVEPLIRDLLSPDQRQQLDSAFFGL